MMRYDVLPRSAEREAAKAKIYQAAATRIEELNSVRSSQLTRSPTNILTMLDDYFLLVTKEARLHQRESLLISKMPSELLLQIFTRYLNNQAVKALFASCVYFSMLIAKAKKDASEKRLQNIFAPTSLQEMSLTLNVNEKFATLGDYMRFFNGRMMPRQTITERAERTERIKRALMK